MADKFDSGSPLGRGSRSGKARAARANFLRALRAKEKGLAGGGKRAFEEAVEVLRETPPPKKSKKSS